MKEKILNKKFNFFYVKNFFNKFFTLFNKFRCSKKLTRVFFILLTSSLFLLVFINREKLSPDNIIESVQECFSDFGAGRNFPYDVSDFKIDNQNFKAIGKNIVFISDMDFVYLNSNAKEISKRKHSFSNPVLKSNNNKLLLFDSYNRSFEIGTMSNTFFKKSLNDDILTGNIASNGTYAFVTKAKGFLGKLEAFKNKKDARFFEYFFSDSYITDLTFSLDGKKCACVGLNSNLGELVSSLFIFNCLNSEPTLKVDFNKSVIFNIKYLNGKNIAIVGDNIFSIVDTGNGKRKDYYFSNKILTSYCITDDKILLSLSLSDDGDNCEILIFNKNGDLENTIKTDLKIKSLSYKFNKIAALSYGVVYIYNNKGKLITSFECSKDAKKIEFLASKQIYVLSLSEIKKFSF